MQNRENALTERGGDTVVMQKLITGLQARGVQVTVDLQGRENPADFDLLHLLNFALPQMLADFGSRAVAAGIPFVVTTLCEDVPSFHYQSHEVANRLIDYVAAGQPKDWWRANRPDIKQIAGCDHFPNEFAVRHAAALFSSGPSETEVLKRDYPGVVNIIEIPLGHEVGVKADGSIFRDQFRISDFVLCVGRLESRKNQLMLLKALEDSELPLVIAAGDFSYQPRYAEAALKFKRKGRTEFLGRLTDEMLASAYQAALVHALPSWFELPGLVSLEAAVNGCNVVATRRGTAFDYLGEDAFWCRAEDDDSIHNAVTAAYYSPLREMLAPRVENFTWENTVARTYEAYQKILDRAG